MGEVIVVKVFIEILGIDEWAPLPLYPFQCYPLPPLAWRVGDRLCFAWMNGACWVMIYQMATDIM